MEKEMTGLYLSGHPMDKYEDYVEKTGCARTYDILEGGKPSSAYRDGANVTVCGIINHITVKQTRTDKANMAFVTLEDLYGTVEIVLFPKVFLKYSSLIIQGNVIAVSGTLSIEDEKDPKVLVNAVFKPNSKAYGATPQATAPQSNAHPAQATKKHHRGLFLKFTDENDPRIHKAQVVTSIFDGNLPLYFYYCDTKKYLCRPAGEFVDVNDTMIAELKRILGDDNVAVIL